MNLNQNSFNISSENTMWEPGGLGTDGGIHNTMMKIEGDDGEQHPRNLNFKFCSVLKRRIAVFFVMNGGSRFNFKHHRKRKASILDIIVLLPEVGAVT